MGYSHQIEKFHTYVISRNGNTGFLFVPSTLSMSHLGRWKGSPGLEIPLAFSLQPLGSHSTGR
jgi:hypothetical protein